MFIVFTLGRKMNERRDPILDRKCDTGRDLAGPLTDSMCAHHSGRIDKPVAISYI